MEFAILIKAFACKRATVRSMWQLLTLKATDSLQNVAEYIISLTSPYFSPQ